MFNFFSKKKPAGNPVFRLLRTDMHSHLIPGIDDGSQDMASSIKLVRGMMDLGYTQLVTTPHILWDIYKNTPDKILAGLEKLNAALKEEGLDISIRAAAEYFIDDHVAELLKNKERLLTIRDNLVLVEFSLAYPSHSLKDILFEMQMQGYQPIIAHPERYIYLRQNKNFFEELKDIGCWFQLNILSLTPHYGKTVTELANYLIKKGYYELIGTDLHHQGHIQLLENLSSNDQLRKLVESGVIRNAEL